jgi:hypothetical protein
VLMGWARIAPTACRCAASTMRAAAIPA